MVVGTAESIADQLKAKVFDAGIDAVILNLPTSLQGYQPGHITALGEALKPLVTG
ncbi:MAG TPA: LLM class F420-dependent oxidoreductase, partial [Mycobacterium sp.]